MAANVSLGSPAPRSQARGGAARKDGPRRSSPRSWAGRAAPERRCMRAGLGVRDGTPSPHAGRAAPPLLSPGAPEPQIPLRRDGGGTSARHWSRGDWGLSIPPPICWGSGDAPARSRPISLVCRPISLVCRPIYPSAATAAPPFPRTRDRVTARSANGKASQRGREVGGVPSGLGRKSCPAARRRARGSRSARPLRLNRYVSWGKKKNLAWPRTSILSCLELKTVARPF